MIQQSVRYLAASFNYLTLRKQNLSVVEKMQPATISTRFHNFNLWKYCLSLEKQLKLQQFLNFLALKRSFLILRRLYFFWDSMIHQYIFFLSSLQSQWRYQRLSAVVFWQQGGERRLGASQVKIPMKLTEIPQGSAAKKGSQAYQSRQLSRLLPQRKWKKLFVEY